MLKFTVFSFVSCLIVSCALFRGEYEVYSPDGTVRAQFCIEDGLPYYSVYKNDECIIRQSRMGLELDTLSYSGDFVLCDIHREDFCNTWETVWGQKRFIKDNHRETTFVLKDSEGRRIGICFRLFDDGVAFRYMLYGDGNVGVESEMTEFNMAEDNIAFWTPACFENDEYHYQKTHLSEICMELFRKSAPKGHAKYHPCESGFNTPVTMITPRGTHLTIHEAALWDYPGMSLELDPATLRIRTLLAGKDDCKARVSLPFNTPWRVILVSEDAAGLISSDMILNLNEPCRLDDVSWIEPMKYIGIWWEYHLKRSSWDYANRNGLKHGATTEHVKEYIDFASEHGIRGVLVEGWNEGWDNWDEFDFTGPYPDFDIKEITDYAKLKNVVLIGHHETGSNVTNYISQMDEAYDFYEKYGVPAVKTGYVGSIEGHYHYDQWMVNHYNSTVVETAEHKMCIDIHEPIKPTGICRTYPNLLSGEGMRGQEQNAYSEGNDVNHNTILPFTRNIAGPMDFTPGIFDVRFLNTINSDYNLLDEDEKDSYVFRHRVHTTLAQQLALYVVFYSPLQMVADLIENYEGHPAFKFIEDVPVDWDDTRVLEAEVGEYLVMARKDRHSDNWFLGGVTNGTARAFEIPLDFLGEGKYRATIYSDSDKADWKSFPEGYSIEEMEVSGDASIDINMASGGGVAISFEKIMTK